MSTGSSPGVAALRELALPVVVVAASDGLSTSCATTTTTYVSLSPPIVSVALRGGSSTAQLVLRTGEFSVSVLTADQAAMAERAGRPGGTSDKMAEAGITPEPSAEGAGAPGVSGPGAVLWCTVTDVTSAGDHLVIFGQVTSFRAGARDTSLLVRHQRRYIATGQPVSQAAADGYPI